MRCLYAGRDPAVSWCRLLPRANGIHATGAEFVLHRYQVTEAADQLRCDGAERGAWRVRLSIPCPHLARFKAALCRADRLVIRARAERRRLRSPAGQLYFRYRKKPLTPKP